MYEYADKAVKEINRRNVREFGKLKLLPFDELNIMRAVKKAYRVTAQVARRKYYQIAMEAYIAALVLLGVDRIDAEEAARDAITQKWIDKLLTEYDPVTLYRFEPEIERKTARTIEALIASHNRNQEIDRALRYWSLQLSQYTITATDRATVAAYKKAGIKRVRWITQGDERVCRVCEKRRNKVYSIDKVPDKAHIGCRCYLMPVTEKKQEE